MSRRRTVLILVLVGLLLRAVPVLWGSTFLNDEQFSMHPDEPKIVRAIDSFPDTLTTYHDYRYPHLLHTGIGLLWWPVRGAMGLELPEQSLPGQPSYERALVFSRVVVLLVFGLGLLVLLAKFARRLGRPEWAPWFVAAGSVQPLLVGNTALAQTDVTGATLLFLVFYVLLRIEKTPAIGNRHALLLGFVQGLSVVTRYVNLAACAGSLLVLVMAMRRGAAAPRDLPRILGLWLLAFAGAVIAFMPGILYDFEWFKKAIEYEFQSKIRLDAFSPSIVLEQAELGCPVWVLIPGLVGAVILILRTRSWAIAASVLTLALYFATTYRVLRADYMMPLLPMAAVFVGTLLGTLWNGKGGKAPRVAALAYVMFGLAASGKAVVDRYRADSLYRFNHWLHGEVAPQTLGLAPTVRGVGLGVPMLPDGYSFVSVHERPEWIVVPGRYARQVENLSQDPAYYGNLGVILDLETKSLGKMTPKDFDFYDDILTGRDGFRPFGGAREIEPFDYELHVTFERPSRHLDMAPESLEVYRRAQPKDVAPKSPPRQAAPR